MAHDRSRSVQSLYQKLIKASPILGIFGHRQVGKTTFVTGITPHYLTFDSQVERKRADSDPEKFVNSLKKHPFGIDECQLVPELFPALKEHVRTNKKPGQFILTDSVRFTSRKAIRESLTGRMMFFELYPLTISELDQRPLPEFFITALNAHSFQKDTFQTLSESQLHTRMKSVRIYLERGGLPGICFLREPRLRQERLDDLHRLILDRDLRLVHETKLSIEVLMRLLKVITKFNWQGYSYAAVKKELGLSPITQKSLLYALESIFLIRRIPIFGGSKGEIILLEDQLEESLLGESSMESHFALSSLIYRNLRAQFHYRLGEPLGVSSYWTRNNSRVPIVLKANNQTLGVIVVEKEEPTLSQTRAAESLLKNDAQSKVVFLSTQARKPVVLTSRMMIVPLGAAV